MERLTTIEREKLGQLWTANRRFLYGMARKLLPSRNPEETLSDLADVFVRLRLLERVEGEESFRGLAVVAMRFIRMKWYKRSAKAKARFHHWKHFGLPKLSTPSRAEETAERNEALDIVFRDAAAFSLKQQDGLNSFCTTGEAANSAGRTAILRLRKTLDPSHDPGGLARTDVSRRMMELRDKGVSFQAIAHRFGHKNVSSVFMMIARCRQRARG